VARLQLSALGSLLVSVDGRPIVFAYDKVPALLVYLAVEAGQAHPRDSLAELLWPNRPSVTSRHNLSQALTSLRQALPEWNAPRSLLILTRERIQFNLEADAWLDVAEFTAALDAVARHTHDSVEACPSCAARLERAVGLYRDDFLAGFSAGDGAGYEQWLLVKRDALQESAARALAQLAEFQAATGQLEAALQHARRQLALDPWREPAFRQAMRFLALAGQRSAALAEFERCRQALNAELGVEPETETRALYERIRAGELVGSLSQRTASPRPARSDHHLPAPSTALVGREPELLALAERCADPGCRLLTLVGPGGVGKTRLALEVARGQVENFPQGVWLVALASLSSPELLPEALASALGVTPYSTEALPAQLLRHLRNQHLLLVLDNFEHLSDGAPFLAEVLAAARHVKLLVTSREQLNLRGEWVFPVEGLSLPSGDTVADLAGSGAAQLFAQCARRVRPDFKLDGADRAAVAAICRMVAGLPLGLELAAAWLPVLSPAEIAQEIEHSLDFLVAELRDLSERHHSLRAVFDQSWRLLDDAERSAFRRLSGLRGGFTRAAAEAVAGAALGDLARLTAKSLLYRTADGRYQLHDLLRQYGEGKLRANPDEDQPTRERHATYYLTFLAAREAALKSQAQLSALDEITAEMENIRAAWEWAIHAGKADLIASAIDTFWLFSEVRGRYAEAERSFRLAVQMLDAAPPHLTSGALALGKALACLGSWHMRMGEPQVLQALGARSLALLRPLNAQREIAFTLNMLAAAAHVQGAYTDERRLLQESIRLGQASGDRWIMGFSLNDLGLVVFLLGDASQARRLCADSLALFQAMGDPRGQAFALHNLGLIMSQLGELAAAEPLLRQSLTLWRLQNHRWGVATTLIRLGAVARARGDTLSARACWREAIQVGLEVGTWPTVLEALVEMAALLHAEGAGAFAASLAQAAHEHPASSAATRRNAESLLAELSSPPETPAPAIETLLASLLATDF